MVALIEQKSGAKVAVGGFSDDFARYEADRFCSELADILGRDRILPKKVRTLKTMLKSLASDSVLGQECLFFTQDSNLKELHSMLSNLRACKIFLLIDEGLNITQIGSELLQDEGRAKNRPARELQTVVQYWTGKFQSLGLIARSDFSRGRETLFEKNEDKYPELVKFLRHLCISSIKKEAKRAVKSTVGSRLLYQDQQ